MVRWAGAGSCFGALAAAGSWNRAAYPPRGRSMRMRALRPSPSYQVLRRSRKRRASTRTTGSTRESKEAGRPYASTATTYSFTRSDSPRRACSTEKRRKRQSRSERQKRSLATIRPSSSRINSSRCGSIHIWRVSRAPGDYLIVANRSSTAPGEAEMGDRREQMTIVGPDFRLARPRERSRCEWRRRLARERRRGRAHQHGRFA